MTIIIFAIANMLRGQAIWSHGFYNIFMLIMIASTAPKDSLAIWLVHSLAMYGIVVTTTVQATRVLLDAYNGAKGAIPRGILRNWPVIPLAIILHSSFALILLYQVLIYWLAGRVKLRVRHAEGFTGALIGAL